MTIETQTTWRDRRDFEERLAKGEGLTLAEIADLIADADAGERATAIVEALEYSLKKDLGLSIIDCTTDDEDGEIRLEIVRDDPDDAAEDG